MLVAKKDKSREQARVAETPQLTHSPFAGLAGLAGVPSASSEPQPTASAQPATDRQRARGRLVLRRETKHRGGKAVIVVAGFSEQSETTEALEELAKELKQLLGCGGTLTREREIVLQGDNPTKIAEHLRSLGYRVVGVGS